MIDYNIKTKSLNPFARHKVRVSNPALYLSQLDRQRGFLMRNKYELKYCKLKGGVCFFVTFTYNDSSMLRFDGSNYINNISFRKLLVNHLYKAISRKYGCFVRHFSVCELGDGKGSRGVGNNPHFHVLFYVYPGKDFKSLPSANQFISDCRSFWCGPDYSSKHPTQYIYGIVSYSRKHSPEVKHEGALSYVCKYVCKDSNFKLQSRQLFRKIFDRLQFCLDFAEGHDSRLAYPDFNLTISDFHAQMTKNFMRSFDSSSIESYLDALFAYFYSPLANQDIHYLAKYAFRFLRSKMLPKVFISNGLGLYGLDFVRDWNHPKLPISCNKQIKYFPIPLYLYRKKFCDVQKYSTSPGVFNTRYVPNREALDRFYFNFDYFKDKVNSFIDRLTVLFRDNCTLHISDINHFLRSIDITPLTNLDLNSVTSDIINKYVVYMLVYFGRNVSVPLANLVSFDDLLSSSFSDYQNFVCQDILFPPDSRLPVYDYVLQVSAFYDYLDHFAVIDSLLLYISYFKDSEYNEKNDVYRQTRRVLFASDLQASSGSPSTSV